MYYQVRFGDLTTCGQVGIPFDCCPHKHKSWATAQSCRAKMIGPRGEMPFHLGVYSVDDGIAKKAGIDNENERMKRAKEEKQNKKRKAEIEAAELWYAVESRKQQGPVCGECGAELIRGECNACGMAKGLVDLRK